MINRRMRLLLCVTLAVVGIMLVWAVSALAGQGQNEGATSGSTAIVDRNLEPVIVTGVFPRVPVNQIFVYRETGGAWEQVPFQVDEVAVSGSYTDTEDGVMDANDEIVFMAGDLGDKATTSIAAALPISPSWHIVEVTDPLSPTEKGWAYVVRSTALTPNFSADYVDYISASQRVSATNYAVGWATAHSGLDYESPFGGGNVLDRTKLRVKYTIGLLSFNLTEDDLPAPPVVLIKDGPVRVIVNRGPATTLAYASFLRTVMLIDFSSISGRLDEVRVSTDLTNTITTGAFYNENAPAGVTIDGSPETVPPALSNAWRQISLDSGTMIQVVDLTSVGGTQYHYYKDDSAVDPDDTGDGMSYGDSGIRVVLPDSKVFTIESVQYILPGKQGNQGNKYYGFFENPLLVESRIDYREKIYLPLVLRDF